jgi:hypothetical protein
MKTILALLAFLSTVLSAQCQTNVYNLNFSSDRFITTGNNRSTIKTPGALTKTYGESRNQTAKVGDLIKFTHFLQPTEKSGSPRCNWLVNSVKKLGSTLKNKDGDLLAKTDGEFIKVTFTLTNTGKQSIWLKSETLFIGMKRTKKESDFDSNPQLPHSDSDRIVGEDLSISPRQELPPGITRTYSIVYEVPLNIQALKFDVRPMSDDFGADRISVPVTLW